MITTNKLVVIFDLDDTLYHEVDFLKSAFQEIAHLLSGALQEPPTKIYDHMFHCYQKGGDAFQSILQVYQITKYQVTDLVNLYRNHHPDITLSNNTYNALTIIKKVVYKVGLITDGKAIQQENKIQALGLKDYFDGIVISETFGSKKPNIKNFKYFEKLFDDASHFMYVGDNTQKDFIAPNALGWTTICLKDTGVNIHAQSFKGNSAKQPHLILDELAELPDLLNQK
jgi:putative hydrolase of the HAD superfamily